MKYWDSLVSYCSEECRREREASKHGKCVRKKINGLSLDAWHLAQYVVEHPERFAKTTPIDLGHFLLLCEKYPSMKDGDPNKAIFLNQYCELEAITEDVTARTLATTKSRNFGFFGSFVWWYLVGLTVISFIFIGALLSNMFLADQMAFLRWYTEGSNAYYEAYFLVEILMSSILLPFYAAGLGTSLYLLRQTQKHLKHRTFDRARVPGHFIRLLLGVIAGGSLVLFPSLWENTLLMSSSSPSLQDVVGDNVGVGQGAIAFVIGYAVEVIYSALDRMKSKMISR